MNFARQLAAARRWRGWRRRRATSTGQAASRQEGPWAASPAALSAGEALPLPALPPGRSSQVLGIRGGGSLAGRLAALGFTPGACVTVLQNSGGSVIVLVLDGRVVLGRAEAGRVLVAAVTPAPEDDHG
jgi:Fe2+ transport system protein FeoA